MPIYQANELEISKKSIRSGALRIDTSAIQIVWVGRESHWQTLLRIAAFLSIAMAGTMVSCAGLLLNALSGNEDWRLQATLFAGGGIGLLYFSTRLPPFRYIVFANIGGQTSRLYTTGDEEQAYEILDAVNKAKGLAD